jgi:sporulation protein YlmC with PRC-barrel domain
MKRHIAIAAFAALAAGPAAALEATSLLDRTVVDLQGETIGPVEELIVDVRAGRVVYVVIDGEQRFHTLPVGALDERLRVDMAQVNQAVRDTAPREDPRYRRARKLIGQPVTHPGDGRIGEIADIEFDVDSGRVERVVVATAAGRRNMPAAVLAHGRFPPLTRWQVEQPGERVGERMGFVRRPATERQRLHDHQW